VKIEPRKPAARQIIIEMVSNSALFIPTSNMGYYKNVFLPGLL
jgi:hypothetical protein